MALSRTQLKSIIKECLFEILKEGLDAPAAAPIRENKTPARQLVRPQSARQAPSPQQQKEDMLEAIFKDTASTTLPKQMANEQSTPRFVREGVEHSGVDEKGPPQGADRWELLAFPDNKDK